MLSAQENAQQQQQQQQQEQERDQQQWPSVVNIRVCLPDGKKLTRRWRHGDRSDRVSG